MKKLIDLLLFLFLASFISCSNDDKVKVRNSEGIEKKVTIFFINDQHGQLNNFSKIKHIIDQEKKQNKNVIVACSGDMFSGNPVVDNYHNEKGYPMIDVMNKVGFDVSVLGNHEFDYGEYHLKRRIEDAKFKWVCANVDMLDTGIPEPHNYYTIHKDGLKITFLGLVETNGKRNATIPSTHPWRVKNISFERPENVVSNFKDLKKQENADVYIALTHYRT